jgi:hypothetical protein
MSLMKRRTFLKAASVPLVSLAAPEVAADVLGVSESAASYLFYDERFREAEVLAAQFADPGALIPVQGDITSIWNHELSSVSRQAPMTMRGVTTESFCFCLEVMLQSHASVTSRIERINRDLFLWTVYSKPIDQRLTTI